MVRPILAGVAGYVALVIFLFTAFSILFVTLGADGAFQEGTYEVSGTWLAITFAVGIIASLVGGLVASMISRNAKPALITLVAIILVLGSAGVVMGALASPTDVPTERGPKVSNTDAMKYARTPLWVAVLNPLIGVAGAITVFKIRSSKSATTATV